MKMRRYPASKWDEAKYYLMWLAVIACYMLLGAAVFRALVDVTGVCG